jgi:phosphoribosylanthranilate isomerase
MSLYLTPGASLRGLIQVAGVLDLAEARLLAESGVHALGFPLRLPVHAQDQSEEEAAALILHLPETVQAVCITYETDPNALLALCRALGVRCAQLHAEPLIQALEEIKRRDPGLFLIKSLIVRPEDVWETLAARMELLAPFVDAFITDTFDPGAGACGATGKTHDWEISRRLAERSPRPLILAGGLGPENVAEAILRVRPAGVDAHTGLEDSSGRKDTARVAAFVRQAKIAFAAVKPDKEPR